MSLSDGPTPVLPRGVIFDPRPSTSPDLRPYFQMLVDLPGPPLDWGTFFGNPHPVEIEVGSGRGLFMVTAGRTQPDTNFVGIECDLKEARRAARRLLKRDLQNTRMIGGDARLLLSKHVSSASVSGVHVYFPDPWWKRRHRKRRIFNSGFLGEVARVLTPGGLLHCWTDVEEYYNVITRLVGTHPAFAALPPPPEREPEHDMDYRTSFERKKRKLGLPIFRARWERRPE